VIGVLLCVAALSAAAVAEKLSVHVYEVPTGDTIGVKVRRRPMKIHLWGVAAPVAGQPYAAQAKKLLSNLLLGKDVFVDVKSVLAGGDRVGKILLPRPPGPGAAGIAPPVDVGLETVSAGSAWWNPTVAPGAKDLQSAQTSAKAAKKGLWVDPHPVAPWTYAKGHEKTTQPAGKSKKKSVAPRRG
jgi:endonuclease YncB( thermonuclease family)